MTNPAIGAIYNYGGDNYRVTKIEPDHFLAIGQDGEWADAVEFTDHVGEGETATLTYVMALADFEANYSEGEIEEGAEASQQPAEGGAPPEAAQQPAGEAPQASNELPQSQPEPTQYPAGGAPQPGQLPADQPGAAPQPTQYPSAKVEAAKPKKS